DHDSTGAVIAFRNRAFEIRVFNRMILDLHGQAAVAALPGETFGNGPRLQDAFHFEAEVVMQARGVVFLNDEERFMRATSGGFAARRFARAAKISPGLVFFQAHGLNGPGRRPGNSPARPGNKPSNEGIGAMALRRLAQAALRSRRAAFGGGFARGAT